MFWRGWERAMKEWFEVREAYAWKIDLKYAWKRRYDWRRVEV